jgi:hypothetical protein
MRRRGAIGVAAGGLVFLGAMTFLPYTTNPSLHGSVWGIATRYPLILTVVGVVAVILAASSARDDDLVLLALATSLSFYLLGAWFPLGAHAYYGLGSGFWLGSVAAAFMSLAGVLGIAGPRLAGRSPKLG